MIHSIKKHLICFNYLVASLQCKWHCSPDIVKKYLKILKHYYFESKVKAKTKIAI